MSLVLFILFILICICSAQYRGRLLEENVYDLLYEQVSGQVPLKLKKGRTSLERKVYDYRKKLPFVVKDVNNIVTNLRERRLCIVDDMGNDVILPQMGEVEDIMTYFYQTYRGEGANKLVTKVERCFIGITRNALREYLSKNEDHTRKKPIFSNKAPLHIV